MRVRFLLAVVALTGACSNEPEECPTLVTDCTPQYEPTFANIHARTLEQSCALGGGSCHASDTSSGGHGMTEIESAYISVSALAEGGECSVLHQRVASELNAYVMPPGDKLPDGELCAISQWIAAGAPR